MWYIYNYILIVAGNRHSPQFPYWNQSWRWVHLPGDDLSVITAGYGHNLPFLIEGWGENHGWNWVHLPEQDLSQSDTLIIAGKGTESPVSLLKSLLEVGTFTWGWLQCGNCWKWTQSPVSCWRVWWNYCVQCAASLLQIHTALAGCTSPVFFYQHQTDHRPAGEGSLRHEPESKRSKEVTDTLQRR